MFPRLVPQHKAFNFAHAAVVSWMRWRLGRQAKSQGMGLHTRDEVRAIGLADLEAVSVWLGEKLFMMGPLPAAVDCTAFGFLSVVYFVYPEGNYFRQVRILLISVSAEISVK
jgi:hypothetical protein